MAKQVQSTKSVPTAAQQEPVLNEELGKTLYILNINTRRDEDGNPAGTWISYVFDFLANGVFEVELPALRGYIPQSALCEIVRAQYGAGKCKKIAELMSGSNPKIMGSLL